MTEKNNEDIKVAKKSKRKKVEDASEYSEGKLIINSVRLILMSDIGYWHIGCNLNYRG